VSRGNPGVPASSQAAGAACNGVMPRRTMTAAPVSVSVWVGLFSDAQEPPRRGCRPNCCICCFI
jgi:hypothetical protein